MVGTEPTRMPPPGLTRRRFSALLGSVAGGGVMACIGRLGRAQAADERLEDALQAIEHRVGGRLGVAVLDAETGRRWGWRAGERFPLCSTFKVVACGAVLARVDGGAERLDRRVLVEAADLVIWSPVTKDRLGGAGMSLAELCEAAITQSDNTAGNLILDSLGGPSAVTDFARSLGDAQTRLDRREPGLNAATPGDERDTTTPEAMVAGLAALVLGEHLSPASRAQLADWLVANRTGNARLRAGLPKEWRVGDKTGSGDQGTTNDIAVIWPPDRKPMVVAVYLTGTTAPPDDRNSAVAEVGRAIARCLG